MYLCIYGKFIPKHSDFGDIGGCKYNVLKVTSVKFGMIVRTWYSLHKPNFVKIAKGGIPLLAKFIPKIINFGNFRAASPHIKSDNGEI